jgi:hypothetical protein
LAGEGLMNEHFVSNRGLPESNRMCQLQYLDEMGQKNNWLNDKLQYLVRKFRWYKKRISQNLRSVNNTGHIFQLNQCQIRPGDIVCVLSKEEISHVLDRFRRTRGCTFQVGMYEYCGKEYKVLKKVDYFYDEAKQKMCKCNGIFLLDGSSCTGKTAYLAPCGRNCFFFWQASWLKRV